jgi:hypothetical protein
VRSFSNKSFLESRSYAKAVSCEVISINEENFSTPKEFRWPAKLVWGQQLA